MDTGEVSVFRTFALRLGVATGIFLVVFTAALVFVVREFSTDLPDLAALERIRPKLTTSVYSSDGELLKTYSIQRRTLIPYGELPPGLIDALIASEDRQFFRHWGINILGLTRAVFVAVRNREGPRATSTVTQQLARDLFLTKERSLVRKFKELILAVRIEQTYTKEEILQLYLNQVYFGGGAYGIEAAAEAYFDKHAKDLTTLEAATLVGILPAPNLYHPIRRPDRARTRRNIVLWAMGQTGALSQDSVSALQLQSLATKPPDEEIGIAPYFTEYVRLTLTDSVFRNDSTRARYAQQLGLPDSVSADELIYEGGLVIETTLDSRLQVIAERVIDEHLRELQARTDALTQAYPDSFPQFVDRYVFRVDSSTGDTLGVDSVLVKKFQAALVSIDVQTGAVRALVGGRDFEESKFNRAVQALRQPGSAFKPFVYTAAIDNGWSPIDQLPNQPITITEMVDDEWHEWRPQNYDRDVGGMTTLREGLRRSINLVALRLLDQISPRLAIQYARQMGITTNLPPVKSLPLGVGEVFLLELTSAYSAFPNRGIVVKPFTISRIASRQGAVLMPKRTSGERRQALNEQTAFIMTTMLQDAVRRGTGGSSRWKYGFYYDAGGKTGTTNDYGDSWFIGFTPHIVTGVWVGFDQRSNTQLTGATGALPIWAKFMKAAHDTLGIPDSPFEHPAGIVEVELDDQTYQVATRYCPSTYTEYLREGSIPRECELHQVGGTAPIRRSDQQRSEPAETESRYRF